MVQQVNVVARQMRMKNPDEPPDQLEILTRSDG